MMLQDQRKDLRKKKRYSTVLNAKEESRKIHTIKYLLDMSRRFKAP